jgi:hypothetical protein
MVTPKSSSSFVVVLVCFFHCGTGSHVAGTAAAGANAVCLASAK